MKRIALSMALLGLFEFAAHADETTRNAYQVVVPQTPQFVPSSVWNDGRLTYIQLPAPYRGDIPAIFSVAQGGALRPVNGRWDQDSSRIVVDGLADHLELKLGQQCVDVYRAPTPATAS